MTLEMTPVIRRGTATLLLLAHILLIGAPAASAHPFSAAQCRFLFQIQGTKVTAFGESWMLDGTTSEELLTALDLDHDGHFNAREIAAMAESVKPTLEAERYFTTVSADGHDLGKLQPFGFDATANNGLVTLVIGFKLPAPIPLDQTKLMVRVDDPEQTIRFNLTDSNPVVLHGNANPLCNWQITDPDRLTVAVSCAP